MYRYLSVAKMIEVEKASDQAGHTYDQMMAAAGRSVAEEIIFAYSQQSSDQNILGLVGSGNNGGDTLVAMTHLQSLGWKCLAYLTADRENDELVNQFVDGGGEVNSISDDKDFRILISLVQNAEIILDGILGTGIKLPLRKPVPAVLSAVWEAIQAVDEPPSIVAVDCPSGIDCDTGEAANECIPADLTVCLAAVKRGLLKLPAFGLLGELIIGEIGLDPDLPVWSDINQFVIDGDSVLAMFDERPLDGHKGTFGKVTVIGGSINYPGAPILAGKAAFRSGAGWVTIAIPEVLHPYMAGDFIEATWLPLPDSGGGFSAQSLDEILEHLDRNATCLVGPGLGLKKNTQKFIEHLVKSLDCKMVFDADGLKMLAKLPDWFRLLPEGSILTPHPGEMSVLTGLRVEQIQADRIGTAEKYADMWGHVVVLKGAFTVVAEPGGRTAILPVATPALARAGTGDVLAGIITGLWAQGMDGFESACAGVWLHAQSAFAAADFRGSTAGVLASDLIQMLPQFLPY